MVTPSLSYLQYKSQEAVPTTAAHFTFTSSFNSCRLNYFSHGTTARSGPGPPRYTGLTIALRHTTVGRLLWRKWSARRWYLYLTTQLTRQTSTPSAVLEPTIPESEQPQSARPISTIKLEDFNVLLTCILVIVILFCNLMHNFFIKSIVFLYMFRAILCPSSGGLNCIYTASGSLFRHSSWVTVRCTS